MATISLNFPGSALELCPPDHVITRADRKFTSADYILGGMDRVFTCADQVFGRADKVFTHVDNPLRS